MRRLIASVFVSTFLALSVIIWWRFSLQAVNPAEKEAKSLVVARGDGIREIAKKLKAENLIRDQVAFFLLIKRLGIEKSIQAGSFHLSSAMTAPEIADKLTRGTEDVWLTIPEGWRAEEILEYLEKQTIDKGNWTKEKEIGNWRIDEGKLFPETYLVPKQIKIDDVRELMRKTFEEKFSQKLQEDIKAAGLTVNEVVTLASMVEREARLSSDRPLVGSVLLNRLKAGMKLDTDATVQYAIGFTQKDGWWKKELTYEDLKIASSYNTYLHAGLPPAPICSPGLAAIEAVIYPAQTDYLYYLSDKSGKTYFAKTLAEHNANVAKYLP